MREPVPFEVESPAGGSLSGYLDLPPQTGPRPAIVICHGFKGFMDWGFFPHLAALLAERGFVVARFNFSGSGMRPGDELVSEPEAFRSATFSKDVIETRAVLNALADRIAPGRVDPQRIGLFGHSRGGGSAVLSAASSSAGIPSALLTWAAVASFDRLSPEEKTLWRQSGEVPVVNARTGQELSIGVEVLQDLEQHKGELDVQGAAHGLEIPWLIVHGQEDETVPVSEARELAAAAGSTAELLEIEGGGHTFGAVHPFAGPTPQLIEAMNATQTFFRRHLAGTTD